MATMHTNVLLGTSVTRNNINIDIVHVFPYIGISLSSTVKEPLLAGIIPSVVLLLSNIISVMVAVLVTRYCCNSSSQRSSPPKKVLDDVYEQVEGSNVDADILISTNPAYGPVIQK